MNLYVLKSLGRAAQLEWWVEAWEHGCLFVRAPSNSQSGAVGYWRLCSRCNARDATHAMPGLVWGEDNGTFELVWSGADS